MISKNKIFDNLRLGALSKPNDVTTSIFPFENFIYKKYSIKHIGRSDCQAGTHIPFGTFQGHSHYSQVIQFVHLGASNSHIGVLPRALVQQRVVGMSEDGLLNAEKAAATKLLIFSSSSISALPY